MTAEQKVTRLSAILSRFTKSGKQLSVSIVGAFGARNVGDLAIMKTIANDLDTNPKIEYSFASRDDLLRSFYKMKTMNPFSFRGILKLVRDDVIVIGGGGLYGHETHRYLVLMLPLLRILQIALGKKLIFYNVGIYNVEQKAILRMLWPVLKNADLVILRDDSDLDAIPPGILRRATVESDITFLLEAEKPRDEAIISLLNRYEMIVGLSLRYTNVKDMQNKHDANLAIELKKVIVDQILKQDIAVVFIPYQPIDSEYLSHYFADLLHEYPNKFSLIDTTRLSAQEIKWIVGRLDLAIGMRLHFQIFSHDLNIPLVGISYAPKCTNFLRNIGAPIIDVYNIDKEALTRVIKSNVQSLKASRMSTVTTGEDN